MTKKKILAALALGLTTTLVACNKENTEEQTTTTAPTTQEASASTADAGYTLGYSIGSSLSNDPNLKDFNLNDDKVMQGVKDAMNGTEPAISEDKIKTNLQTLSQSVQAKANQEAVENFLANRDDIVKSDLTPKTDVKGAKVAVYEFFDYQCLFCSKVSPEIEKLMADNKNVDFVFVEFPIFGKRWSESQYAAEVGTAVYKIGGANAYMKFHNAVFETGHDEGKLTNKDVDAAIKASGVDAAKIKETIKSEKIVDHLQNTLKTGFEKVGIQGTPFLVIAPIEDATADNTTVIAGYSQADAIQAAIDKATPKATTPKAEITADTAK